VHREHASGATPEATRHAAATGTTSPHGDPA
jgi:hypothetical protein